MAMENGAKKLLDTAATRMKENIRMIGNAVKVFSSGKVVTDILVNMMMMKDTELEKCYGPMGLDIKVNGSMVYKMALVLCTSRTGQKEQVSSPIMSSNLISKTKTLLRFTGEMSITNFS